MNDDTRSNDYSRSKNDHSDLKEKKTNTKNYLKVYSIIFTQQKRKNTINSNLQHHFLHFKYFVMQD